MHGTTERERAAQTNEPTQDTAATRAPQASDTPRADRWALVTGASSGIGAAYARVLAERGQPVALVARRRDRLQALAAELEQRHGVRAETIEADLSGEQGVGAVEAWIALRGPLQTLVHAAGFGTRDHFAALPADRTLQMVRLHVEAAVRLARAALPAMLEARGGAVILVSSLAGFFTTARYVTYSATKAYLNQFAEGLQAEVGPAGIRVQAVCPGLTRTEFLDSPDYDEFKYEQVPRWAWMSAEQVVRESLAALDRGQPTVLVPGWPNRLLAGALQTPGLGRALRWGIDRLSAGGLY